MNIAGLPAHVLIIHAAVVFGPVAALGALAYAGLPRHRDLLRWPVLVLAVIAFGTIWAAYLSGDAFFESDRFANVSGELRDNIETHEDYASMLRWIATVFAITTVATTYSFHAKPGTARNVLTALMAVSAVGTLVWVILTGDAGSRAVWS